MNVTSLCNGGGRRQLLGSLYSAAACPQCGHQFHEAAHLKMGVEGIGNVSRQTRRMSALARTPGGPKRAEGREPACRVPHCSTGGRRVPPAERVVCRDLHPPSWQNWRTGSLKVASIQIERTRRQARLKAQPRVVPAVAGGGFAVTTRRPRHC